MPESGVRSVTEMLQQGNGDSSVVRAPDSWSKDLGFESPQERRKDFPFRGQLSMLTVIQVSVPPPCYCSIMQKIPVILPTWYRWQVTAKHTRILRMWLRMIHVLTSNEVTLQTGAYLYGAHRTCIETAAVVSGHARTKQCCKYNNNNK